ncbi:LysR family transcriptional regulator [Paraburkholderia caledonica]|uniref:LysR family transcriptional regulator for bpeEF and oprC n=1 Tax=Paraburkholderia caledonica TaxID=134536 RepID=A0ABU1KYX7_9BURK|nr:LysR family transcriptional regulator [Paraburkholderia caledonica]MDR6376166.1 LysR family transcriptional regulator for bpeEF and oprC [Paraburkholderia caledonica]
MDRLQAMKMFTKIVDMNSFSRAADSMGLPHASATMIMKNLESHLRVRLMQRTTRRLSLTPEGAEYYERCVRILADIDETEGALAHVGRGPRGKLKVDMPAVIGRLVVVPRLAEFRDSFPDIELTITFGDKPIDLIQESVDCAIRTGPLQDSTLVARRLASLPTLTAASPDYIAAFGEPQTIEDLEQHNAVQYFSQASGRVRHMNFVHDGGVLEVKVPGTIAVSDAEAYVMCGANGIGIIQALQCVVEDEIASGRMVQVLPDWQSAPLQVSAVYPHSKHLAAKVRIFVDWLAAVFEQYTSAVTERLMERRRQSHAGQQKDRGMKLIRGGETAVAG